jgi:hypothetical protein
MLQKHSTGACIFCQNKVAFFQKSQCPEGNVLQVSDGGGNQVKHKPVSGTKKQNFSLLGPEKFAG